MKTPGTLPVTHRQLLLEIIATLSKDERIVGIAAGGSYSSDSMDEYSDLDLVIAIAPEYFQAVMEERFEIVDRIGGKLAAFTGEHVGEPRLVIALYGPHPVHVDYKFVSLPDAAARVDDTKVLWERSESLSQVLAGSTCHYPQPDPQWIEDRFWIWVHYATTKIGRGEFFEAMEFLSFLRVTALSPLALMQEGLTPSGVRKIEARLPIFAGALKETVAVPEAKSLMPALNKCVELYLGLRGGVDVVVNSPAQETALGYLKGVEEELDARAG